ncbi:MAG: glycoside hydrolase family 43 protein [Fimbriimonadaceae bacterium]|nr:glycoside hydrolase family 43 protein [Fimbriimonadaceae bacterium]
MLVWALPLLLAGEADEVFLFSYFRGNGESGLHLAWSEDGRHFSALREGASFLAPSVQHRIMRDPCLLRHPDGHFELVWTSGWTGRGIAHATSVDLLTWSTQQGIEVMAQEPTARNCWAPEVVWDAARGEYLIYWSTTIPGRFAAGEQAGDDGYNHRLYATSTRDWQTFSPTRLLYDPGFNTIDATLLPFGGRWYAIIKDETRRPPRKDLRVAVGDHPQGPFGPAGEPFTTSWVEGPTAAVIDGWVYVYMDAYTAGKYVARRSRDLVTWEDVPDLTMPAGARHGTVLRVPRVVVERLR